MMLHKLPLLFLAAATCVFASPVDLASRSLYETLDQALPDGPDKDLYLKYKPYLRIVQDCVPYPAVDREGNTNPGTASPDNNDCNSSGGQMYGRIEHNYNGYIAIMYTWYFRRRGVIKASGFNGSVKHDWQQVIIWIDPRDKNAPVKHSWSQPYKKHGDGYHSQMVAPISNMRATFSYEFIGNKNEHGLQFSNEPGKDYNLIAWEKFTPQARQAINNPDNFDKNSAPFSDLKFSTHLQASFS